MEKKKNGTVKREIIRAAQNAVLAVLMFAVLALTASVIALLALNAAFEGDVVFDMEQFSASDTEKDASEQGNASIASVVARIVADGEHPLDDGVPVGDGQKKSQQGDENTHPSQDEVKSDVVSVGAHAD